MPEPELPVEPTGRPPAPAPTPHPPPHSPPLPPTAPSVRSRRRRWLRLSILFVGLLAGLAIVRSTLLAPDTVSVAVASVGRGDVEETVTNSRAGTVKARR